MQGLEKILKEIDEAIDRYGNNPHIDEKVTDLCYGMKIAKDIIRKYMNDGWIPVEERLPEEDGFYIATIDGEIAGQEESFVGLAEFEDDFWVDDDIDYKCIIAWRPLPEPYSQERSENDIL